jgi:hypothetical protein
MSDQYSNPFGSFIFGGTSDTPTYEELKRRRAIAAALAARQRGYPKNIGEGLTALGEGIYEGVSEWRLRQQEEKLRGINQGLRGGPPPEADGERPATPAPAPVSDAGDPAGGAVAFAMPEADVPAVEDLPPPMAAVAAPPPPEIGSTAPIEPRPVQTTSFVRPPDVDVPPPQGEIPFEGPMPDPRVQARMRALGGIETGGSRTPYEEEGAVTRSGDQAQGKYQIMGKNVPGWTKEALGYSLTPEEFRAHPNAQEITARQRLGGYVDKYGEEGAARAWYGGERGMRNLGARDVHGRLTVADYGQDFMRRLAADTGEESPRSRVAAALVRQGRPAGPDVAPEAIAGLMPPQQLAQQPEQPPGETEVRQQAILKELLGGGRGGRGPATAALGREGVGSDAPLPGIGALPGLEGSIRSREGIYNAVQQQQGPAPAPAPDVPQAGANVVAQAPTGAATDAGGGAGAAGASMFDPRPISSMPPAAFTPTGAQQGIGKAPAKLPSEEAIPPAAPLTAKQPGALEPPPTASKPGREETYWRNVMRHPSADTATQAYAKEQAEQYERSRLKADERAYEQWTHKRSVTQAEQTKYEESLRTAPREALEQHKVRLEIQKAQADARMQPDQALKLQKEIEAVDAQIQKTKQGLITPAAGPSAGYDTRLGTPQSPQRNRNPAPPPVPPGTAPEMWADQQSKSIKKDLDAVDAAEPEFRKMLETIDYVRKHPGKKLGTGPSSLVMPPNTDAYTFSGGKEGGLIGQLKGKNFLSGYAKLKGGGGQISNIEGEKTEQSQAALNPLAGEKAMDAALNAMEDSIRYDLEVAQRRTHRPVTAWQRTPNDPYAPDLGERKGNKEYIGGKPSDPNSWRDVR